MASITNPWLTPLQRGYQSIKDKLINSLLELKNVNGTPLISDVSEGNILVLIISLFSGIAETLHYYIDANAREFFVPTARKYSSLVKSAKLVDYHPKAATAATVDLILTRSKEFLNRPLTISKGLEWVPGWYVIKDYQWSQGVSSITISLINHTYLEITQWEGVIFNPTVNSNYSFTLSKPSEGYYEEGTMVLEIDGERWSLVETLAFSKPNDRHFIASVDEEGSVVVTFGDGIFGHQPNPSSVLTYAACYITQGADGNVPSGYFTTAPSNITSIINNISVNNPYPASGGTNLENIDTLREHIGLSVKTLGVAITKQDFIDLAKQVPGVNQAYLEYICGRKLKVYIVPWNGIVATKALCDRVYQYLFQHSPMSTWLMVSSIGYTPIHIDMVVTGHKSCTATEIRNQIITALTDKYSVDNSTIRSSVRISDIYALIDNLSTVDYLTINKFYIEPWPTTISGINSLYILNYEVEYINQEESYLISFTSPSEYMVYSDHGNFTIKGTVGNNSIVVEDSTFNNKFSFSIPFNYTTGDKFRIKVIPSNRDYLSEGYNLPIFDSPNNLKLTINEVL